MTTKPTSGEPISSLCLVLHLDNLGALGATNNMHCDESSTVMRPKVRARKVAQNICSLLQAFPSAALRSALLVAVRIRSYPKQNLDMVLALMESIS